MKKIHLSLEFPHFHHKKKENHKLFFYLKDLFYIWNKIYVDVVKKNRHKKDDINSDLSYHPNKFNRHNLTYHLILFI